jgi:hypothetical protein
MSNNSNASSGVSVFTLLGVLFIGLKLTKVIEWSWWWVTVPFWGGLGLIIAISLFVFILTFIIAILERK